MEQTSGFCPTASDVGIQQADFNFSRIERQKKTCFSMEKTRALEVQSGFEFLDVFGYLNKHHNCFIVWFSIAGTDLLTVLVLNC